MPTDEDIRKLCIRAVHADSEEFQATIDELRTVLRKHVEEAENRSMAILLQLREITHKK